jgi:hypothetical protein
MSIPISNTSSQPGTSAFLTNLGLFFPCKFIRQRDHLLFMPSADFYLQLYALEKGVHPKTAFYSVRPCRFPTNECIDYAPTQLAILNAANVIGRLLPSVLADHVGVYNTLIPSLFISAVVLFSMLALDKFKGILTFGLLYGFSSGACAPRFLTLSESIHMMHPRCISHPASPRPTDGSYG